LWGLDLNNDKITDTGLSQLEGLTNLHRLSSSGRVPSEN
jgi:hypothetical protein